VIGLLNDLGAAWATYFGPVVVQNTVFLAVVLVVLHLLRNASARVRYVVGLIGMIKLLLPPFVPIRLSESTNAILVPLSQFASSAAPITSAVRPEPLAPLAERPEWVGLLFAAWLGVTAIYIIGTVISTIHLRLALGDANDITETLAPQFVGVTRIGLYQSNRIAMPLTVGVLPTKIFVPAVWNQWSEECRRMIIRHEVAHIRRRDGIVQILQILAQSLYFFHPLVWFLNRRINEYREMACDDAATGLGSGTRLRYSRHLANIAESAILSPLTGDSVSALLRRKHELLNRIQYQMKEGKMSLLSRSKTAFMLVGLILLVVPLSGYVGTSVPSDRNDGAQGEKQVAMSKDDSVRYVTVGIVAPKTIEVDGMGTSFTDFKKRLVDTIGDDRDHVVIRFVCEKDTPMGTVFDVQRALGEIDLLRVSYMSYSHGAMPLVLPSKELEEKIKEIPAEYIAELVIEASGGVLIDRQKIEVDKLDKVVKGRLADNPKLIVSVQADREATYGQYVSVLNQLKEGGAQRIHVHNASS
jgi:beta-lactamase regulating signal transducer with metallopeptidase domain